MELSEICAQYGADTTYTLYMVDDEWDQEQYFTIFIIRLGASALLFFILAVGLLSISSGGASGWRNRFPGAGT